MVRPEVWYALVLSCKVVLVSSGGWWNCACQCPRLVSQGTAQLPNGQDMHHSDV